MKRKWAEKVKAVPACKAKRQVQTSAAMIGLIISTGASNLILTRPSDGAPVAEPLVKEATLSKVPTNTEAGQADSVNLGQPSVEKVVPVATSFSTLVTPTELVELQAVTLATPALTQVEPKEQKEQTLNQLSSTAQVEAAPRSTHPAVEETLSSSVANVHKRNIAQQPEQQAQKVIRTLRVDRLIRKLKQTQTVARSSESNVVNRSHIASAVLIASSKSVLAEESVPVISEAKSKWTAKQRLVINLLKQKSNRLQDSRAKLRFEESKYSSAPVTQLMEPISGAVKAETAKQESFSSFEIKLSESQQAASLGLLPQGREKGNGQQAKDWTNYEQSKFSPSSSQSLEQLKINHQLKIPDLADSSAATSTTNGQKPSALLGLQVATNNESTKFDSVPPQGSQATVVAANLPNIVVKQPTVVVPMKVLDHQVKLLDYQVKAGDTLTAIAHQHRLPLSELIAANHLENPNRLQVKQRITIPVLQSGINVSQNTGLVKRIEQGQLSAASVVSNLAADSQPARSFVPPESLAAAPSLNSPYSGMGGEIADDDTVQPTPQNVEEIQQQQSAAAQKVLLSNLYVQNLRTDIQKLRQKYRPQGILTSQALPSVNETSTMPPTAANSSGKPQSKLRPNSPANQPINPEFSANQAAKTLQPNGQKQLPVPVRATEVRVRNRVATVPLGTDSAASLQSYQEQNVFPALPPLGGVDTYLPKPTSISARAYIWPAKGRLSSGYGWRWGRMHKGIDIAAPIGTPVFAAATGVVVKAGWNSGGYGNLVDIQHADGSVTRYGHNKRILVQAGQVVQQGQQISEMGSTGFSTGPHLHFEVHPLGKKAVNPIAYLPR